MRIRGVRAAVLDAEGDALRLPDDAEARRVFNMRVRVIGSEKWTTLDMNAFESFEDNRINLLTPLEGASVPEKREVLLEQNALKDLDVKVGDLLEFQLPDGSIKTLPVTGSPLRSAISRWTRFLISVSLNRSTAPWSR